MELYVADIEKITEEDIRKVEKAFPERFGAASKHKYREGFLRSVAGSLLLLRRFPELEEKAVTYGKYGKPEIKGTGISISHSGKYAVLAVSGGVVGADIEKIKSGHERVAERCFDDNEKKWMDGRDERFAAIWTMKESVMKALGLGLGLGADRFSVYPFISGGAVSVCGKTFFNKTLFYDGHVISVSADTYFEEPVILRI